jgi:hypothetical protein
MEYVDGLAMHFRHDGVGPAELQQRQPAAAAPAPIAAPTLGSPEMRS